MSANSSYPIINNIGLLGLLHTTPHYWDFTALHSSLLATDAQSDDLQIEIKMQGRRGGEDCFYRSGNTRTELGLT